MGWFNVSEKAKIAELSGEQTEVIINNRIIISDTEPESPDPGTIWIDTSED